MLHLPRALSWYEYFIRRDMLLRWSYRIGIFLRWKYQRLVWRVGRNAFVPEKFGRLHWVRQSERPFLLSIPYGLVEHGIQLCTQKLAHMSFHRENLLLQFLDETVLVVDSVHFRVRKLFRVGRNPVVINDSTDSETLRQIHEPEPIISESFIPHGCFMLNDTYYCMTSGYESSLCIVGECCNYSNYENLLIWMTSQTCIQSLTRSAFQRYRSR